MRDLKNLLDRLLFPLKWLYFSVVILMLKDSLREHRDIYLRELEDYHTFGGNRLDCHLYELHADLIEREQQIARWSERRRAL